MLRLNDARDPKLINPKVVNASAPDLFPVRFMLKC